MLTSARVQLLQPRPQRPTRQYLLELLSANIQSALNEANNGGRSFATATTLLTVSPGTDEYIINGQNIGRVLDCTTWNPTDSGWIERPIDFFDWAGMTEDWGLFRDSASWMLTPDGGPHTALRIAFFKKGGAETMYARVLPVPQASAQYRVAYAIRELGGPDTPLDFEPLLSNHHHYWVAVTARDALPACQWSDDKKADQEQRANLKSSFDARIATYAPQFKNSLESLTLPRDSVRVAPFPIDG